MWESIMYLIIGNNEKSNTQIKENQSIENEE